MPATGLLILQDLQLGLVELFDEFGSFWALGGERAFLEEGQDVLE